MKYKITEGSNQPEPAYQSSGAAAFDLCSTESVHLDDHLHMMNLGIAFQIPFGFYGKLVVRSSMAKRGIMLGHGTGVIDSDFRGEVFAPLYSRHPGGSKIEEGERIVQMIICPRERVQLERVDDLEITARGSGGFGSTN